MSFDITHELHEAGDDHGAPAGFDLDEVMARGRRRRRRRAVGLGAAAGVAVVAIGATALGNGLTVGLPGGSESPEASCAAILELDGRTYFGHGELKTTPPTTERTGIARDSGCDDGGGDPEVRDVVAHELVGVPMSKAFLAD